MIDNVVHHCIFGFFEIRLIIKAKTGKLLVGQVCAKISDLAGYWQNGIQETRPFW
jgi:hypothetical protein